MADKAKARMSRGVSLSQNWDMAFGEPRPSRFSVMTGDGEKPLEERDLFEDSADFCTGSNYAGQFDKINMCGFGTYNFIHGVEYEGWFLDGMFHGEGTMKYPNGQKLDGCWEKGKMVSAKFRFSDDLELDDRAPWDYCVMPDRRFQNDLQEGFQPPGAEFITHKEKDPPAKGQYDAGDGYFCPDLRIVRKSTTVKPDDEFEKSIIRIPTDTEKEWIEKFCRRYGDCPIGFEPDLYEVWVGGKNHEINMLYDVFDQFLKKVSIASVGSEVMSDYNLNEGNAYSSVAISKDLGEQRMSIINPHGSLAMKRPLYGSVCKPVTNALRRLS